MSTTHRILVVDDSPVCRRVLTSALGEVGYEVLVATDGYEAVEVARAARPDLILLDVGLPHRDGFEVCEMLRSEEGTARTPIIFLTGVKGPEHIARAFAIGASDYVTKPFEFSEIKARVSVHLKLLRAQSELELSHAQALRAQKLESLGQLAAGVAHEINTPTQYVSDNVRFLQDAFTNMVTLLGELRVLLNEAQDSSAADVLAAVSAALEEADLDFFLGEVPAALSQSIEGLERIAKIVRAMKDFSHPGEKEMTRTDIHRGIESTVTVARNEWKYAAEVVMEFDPALPEVHCSIGDLNQVVLNLIVNAAHAIREKLGEDSAEKGRITIATHLDGDWAEIRISDTGCGIPAEIRESVFDPFFTTKGVGKGTGQGLAIAHSVVVEMHGGNLSLESVVGTGTTFIIRLPVEPVPESVS